MKKITLFLGAVLVTTMLFCRCKEGGLEEQRIFHYQLDSLDAGFGNSEKIAFYQGRPFSGIAIEFWPKTDFVWFETPYKNGKVNGIAIGFYENGNLQYEEPFSNGKLNGLKKHYFENGVLSYEIQFKNGEEDGVFKKYNENGILVEEQYYKYGRLDGVSKKYNEKGILIEEQSYKNGELDGLSKKKNKPEF